MTTRKEKKSRSKNQKRQYEVYALHSNARETPN
jgi:hypothetical protein